MYVYIVYDTLPSYFGVVWNLWGHGIFKNSMALPQIISAFARDNLCIFLYRNLVILDYIYRLHVCDEKLWQLTTLMMKMYMMKINAF